MQFYAITQPVRCLAAASERNPQRRVALNPDDDWPTDLKSLIALWESSSSVQQKLLQYVEQGSPLAPSEVVLDAPIRHCEKLICVGKNYADHALEMGGDVPELPVIFSKFSSAIHPPEVPVELPAISQQVDYEAELVVVIGRSGKNISRQDAMSHVFGYCCGNDISARDWQKGRPGGQWLLGKTFDGFAPLGPFVTTADQVGDPHQLAIECRLNGAVVQSSHTSQLIFRIDYLIAHVSQFFRLTPGDLIFTGTPAGVGAGKNPPVFLKPGDHLEVEIQNLGVLANRVNLNAS